MKEGLKLIVIFLLIGFVLFVQCTTLTYCFNNPQKSQTQVFLHIPKSFMLDVFKESPDEKR
jgi:hypothetical protein